MAAPKNQAAWLHQADTALKVGDAPFPEAGPGELVVKNAVVAINPLDWHMQDAGVFIQQWPAIFGCDVAGEVYQVGPGGQRFKKGDRVIGHAINLVSGRNQDSAYALYTVIPANKAAILPDNIPFTDGVVVPFALEAAICALCVKEPGVALPGISAPAWALPYPSVEDHVTALGKTLVVTGGSASAGSMTTQIATAAGMHVVAITGHKNFDLSKRCGATDVFDHKDPSVVDKVVEAIRNSGNEFVGIFDAISIPDTYTIDLAILAELGGGQLACTHPPPPEVPQNVKAGMILAVNDIATPVWRDYVTPALKAGKLQCLPAPTIVGKGLEHIQDALKKSKTGVSATKLVVEL